MPVGIVCPACSTPLTFHRAPVGSCPQCQALFPDALRSSAEATLLRQAHTKPMLLSLGTVASPGLGALVLITVLTVLAKDSAVDVNGDSLSRLEYLRASGAILLLAGFLLVAI